MSQYAVGERIFHTRSRASWAHSWRMWGSLNRSNQPGRLRSSAEHSEIASSVSWKKEFNERYCLDAVRSKYSVPSLEILASKLLGGEG